ncbi:glycoside hydrolase family protein [Niabella ginsenosidivorans]|nr:hypothetical protein [Niabella ginsenosidivorans]
MVSLTTVGQKTTYRYVPVIDGNWWTITTNPDLGKYTSPKQEPVDFGVWQAADGTWQLWSCIRGTRVGGNTRLFFGWEGKNITDTNWSPKGITMMADTTVGETKGGLQAPYVFSERNRYYMFYGDWNHICLATSTDGKNFKRALNTKGTPALFSGNMANTRDPMVIKIDHTYYCYYSAHLLKDDPAIAIKSAVYCRQSADMQTWSEPVIVSDGGSPAKQTSWYGGASECPFVVKIDHQYVLFRNQNYGKNALNTQYSSPNPLDFGIDNDRYQVGQLAVAAPEIIKVNNQYYIIALKPDLNGMQAAKLRFVKEAAK